jgi:beta-1,4-mannosyl-glycoprotein beta-1,4-N-acetylglucosaminyltransferase
LDLLEIRLDLLYDHVDYFVISETNKTHADGDKIYYFEENKSKFEKYMDKIIHIKTEYPLNILYMGRMTGDDKYSNQYNIISERYDIEENEGHLKKFPTFCRDYLQKEFIKFGLMECSDDDLIMISDLDEIPNPDFVDKIKNENLYNTCLLQDCFYYYINLLAHTNWYGNYVVRYSDTKGVSLTHLKNKRVNFNKIENGGWHFSFMGGKDRVIKKLESYAHQEFNNDYIKNSIESKMESGLDLFNRSGYSDPTQKFFFNGMLNTSIDNYPKKMIDLIKLKYDYLIKK